MNQALSALSSRTTCDSSSSTLRMALYQACKACHCKTAFWGTPTTSSCARTETRSTTRKTCATTVTTGRERPSWPRIASTRTSRTIRTASAKVATWLSTTSSARSTLKSAQSGREKTLHAPLKTTWKPKVRAAKSSRSNPVYKHFLEANARKSRLRKPEILALGLFPWLSSWLKMALLR